MPGKVVGDESGDEVVGVVVARLQTNGAVDTGLRNNIRQFFWLREAENSSPSPVHKQIRVPIALGDPERGIMGPPILLVVSRYAVSCFRPQSVPVGLAMEVQGRRASDRCPDI